MKTLFLPVLTLLTTTITMTAASPIQQPSTPSPLTNQLWSQCDPKWGSAILGFTQVTICKGGNLLTSLTMMVTSLPTWIDPGLMNTWLKQNGGFVNGGEIVWSAVNKFGLKYGGLDVYAQRIALHLMAGHFVLLNYYNETVWALANSQTGTKIFSNDPIWGNVILDVSDIRAFAWYQRPKVDGQTNAANDAFKNAKNKHVEDNQKITLSQGLRKERQDSNNKLIQIDDAQQIQQQ